MVTGGGAINMKKFSNLATQYLDRKKVQVGRKHFRNISSDMSKFVAHFGDINIHKVQYGELEDFLFPLAKSNPVSGLSGKTVANIRSTISDFYKWLVNRKYLKRHEVPDIPKVPFKLGWRNTITREVQDHVIEKVITLCDNPRVGIAIKFLATYVNVRPGELVQIREGDIDLEGRRIKLRRETTKEGDDKYIFLIDEDIGLLKSLQDRSPKAFPALPFFRHFKGNGAAKPGQQFGHDLLYKWWKRACKELGVEGVDLYGGTRHSSVIYLREQGFSPEEVKRASMHSTNKAFERYLQVTANELTPIYGAARNGKKIREEEKIC
jgi:integrase